tara:strand:- start:1667 stop:1984 length:318 start_codon:yes stop_codon:yes gene_type:complete
MNNLNSTKHINQRAPRKQNSLAEQMKIKRFDPIELKAWNSIYPDIQYKNKKHNSQKIFDGKVQADHKIKPPPKKEFDIVKKQKATPYKKIKKKNPNVFQEKKKKV